jgi:hypothetical protein
MLAVRVLVALVAIVALLTCFGQEWPSRPVPEHQSSN